MINTAPIRNSPLTHYYLKILIFPPYPLYHSFCGLVNRAGAIVLAPKIG